MKIVVVGCTHAGTASVVNLKELYPELEKNKEIIKQVIIAEKDKFTKTLQKGEKEFEKVVNKLKQENKKCLTKV